MSQKKNVLLKLPSALVTSATKRGKGAVVTCTQHFEHRHDAYEDAEEELGNLQNRVPCEVIGLTRSLGGKHERKPRERQEAEITNDRLEAQSARSGT